MQDMQGWRSHETVAMAVKYTNSTDDVIIHMATGFATSHQGCPRYVGRLIVSDDAFSSRRDVLCTFHTSDR